jgi:hypothetical protein
MALGWSRVSIRLDIYICIREKGEVFCGKNIDK